MIVTKEDIDKYVELDKKIKERIVQISDVLIRVSDETLTSEEKLKYATGEKQNKWEWPDET